MQTATQQWHRRTFLARAGMAGTAILAGSRIARAIAPKAAAAVRLGAQTNAWPIDPHNLDTLLAALQQMRQLGYQGFETGFRNLQDHFAAPAEANAKLAASGLTFFGTHIYLGPHNYDPQTSLAPQALYERVARGASALGSEYLILSGDPTPDPAARKRKIDGLNAAGAFCKSVGIGLAYHNHAPEFEHNAEEMNALVADSNPALVKFVLDAGHAYEAHADASAFFAKHRARIAALHLRDYRNGRLVSLGSGEFPLAQLAATVRRSRWSGWVENEEEREDGSHRGLEIMEPAFKAMKEAFSA